MRSIASLPRATRQTLVRELPARLIRRLRTDWIYQARPEQLPPPGDWRTWLFLGGRGSGKTRAGAEWIADGVRRRKMRRIGVIGATWHDVRSVMIEGESGLLAATDATFEASNHRIKWANGAIADVVSAEEPDAVRGHQFDCVWADEFCKWAYPQESLDMIVMALRLGKDPRMLVTTTPRAIKALKDLMAMPDVVRTHSTTKENAANLAPTFLAGLELRYGGTRLGRQEMEAELIEDNDAALWKRDWIEAARVRVAPSFNRVVVAVDPPVSVAGDECGIVAAGRDDDGQGYVIADRSVAGLTAAGWAARVAETFAAYHADAIVAEANQGGDMVKQVLIDALPNAPVRLVHAVRDKRTRAVPAAALYEQGRIHHIGAFADLEDQMVSYDGSGQSPDRMDALVWALADLFPLTRANPRVRRVE
ncbi:terminase large subunit domain-containing protein [Rhizomicrobium electricum]|uniref:terminase large subunit domain-containing protein n=1 Tax=Rhizomicrobium electricum TaxID=480070 RepID=UPI001ABA0B1E|nr:phage terminase large subunit-like protein [Rhizomicrobium electricum]